MQLRVQYYYLYSTPWRTQFSLQLLLLYLIFYSFLHSPLLFALHAARHGVKRFVICHVASFSRPFATLLRCSEPTSGWLPLRCASREDLYSILILFI